MSSLLVLTHPTRLAADSTILLMNNIYPFLFLYFLTYFLTDAHLQIDISQGDNVTALDGHRNIWQDITLIQLRTV
jgi:hypothetical protein